ncbi:hypothetical protein [Brucella endophytica]|uniref:hypothetical protein n=1 Tax=Brucella endophytica TaxID=1963359 RepID=UPI0035BBD8FB
MAALATGSFGLAQWSNLPFPLAALIIAGFVFIIKPRSLNACTGAPAAHPDHASAFITGVIVAFSDRAASRWRR